MTSPPTSPSPTSAASEAYPPDQGQPGGGPEGLVDSGLLLDGLAEERSRRAQAAAAGADSARLRTAVYDALAADRRAGTDGQVRHPTASSQVDRLLETVPVIEQAKGIVMGYYGLDADAAFELLRRWSSHTNLKLGLLARHLVELAARPGGRPYEWLQTTFERLSPP